LCLAAVSPASALEVGADFAVDGRDVSGEGESLDLRSRFALRLEGTLAERLTGEALAALWLRQIPSARAIADEGSFVRLGWRPAGWAEGEGLSLRLFPFESGRLRLGYDYPVAWSGELPGSEAQGAEARLTRSRWYGFVAARTSQGTKPNSGELQRLFLLLAGGGFDLLPVLRLEAAGGYADQGAVAVSARQGYLSASAEALSGRVLFHRGAPVGRSVDLSFFRNEPGFLDSVLAAENYSGGVSTTLSLEGLWFSQTGVFGDGASGEPALRRDWSGAGALQARVKAGFLRAHALGMVRSLSLAEAGGNAVTGASPYLQAQASSQPEWLVSAGVDYHFAAPGLTPGLVLRVGLPATLASDPPPFISTRPSTVVVGETGIIALAPGASRQATLTTKATLRWGLDESVCAVGEAWWTRDPNRLAARSDALIRSDEPSDDVLGFAFLLQAGF